MIAQCDEEQLSISRLCGNAVGPTILVFHFWSWVDQTDTAAFRHATGLFASQLFRLTPLVVLVRNPSSPLILSLVRPPARASGRRLSVTAIATIISLARGASLMRTSMPSNRHLGRE